MTSPTPCWLLFCFNSLILLTRRAWPGTCYWRGHDMGCTRTARSASGRCIDEGNSMKPSQQKFASLGEVVVTAFDQARGYSANPAEVAHLASLAVMRLWLRNMQALAARPQAGARKQGQH